MCARFVSRTTETLTTIRNVCDSERIDPRYSITIGRQPSASMQHRGRMITEVVFVCSPSSAQNDFKGNLVSILLDARPTFGSSPWKINFTRTQKLGSDLFIHFDHSSFPQSAAIFVGKYTPEKLKLARSLFLSHGRILYSSTKKICYIRDVQKSTSAIDEPPMLVMFYDC